MRGLFRIAAVGAAALIGCTAAMAQVPPEIAAKNKASAGKIDFTVGALYAALQPKEPYDGITVVRDVATGSDPLQKIDVFQPTAKGPARPVMIFVHGGGFVRGDKKQTDNMLVWAVDHGMVGVDVDYRLAPKDPWPAGAQDLEAAVAWTRANIAAHGGDPNRVILWGHSAGANHVEDYVAHAELHGPEYAGVRGAIIMSPFYAAAATAAGPPNPYYGTDASLSTADAANARMVKSSTPIYLVNAEYDPPFMISYGESLDKALTDAHHPHGRQVLKDHGHLSEGLAVGTSDVSLTGPLLVWLHKVE
ncbi:MAG TPA: alpha/beta hydrolase [Caulobacteraceae bacterium]